VTLGKAGIKTLDDLADLATDELVEKKRAEPRRRNDDAPKRPEPKGGILSEYGLSDEQGNEIIMAARAHWFADEETPAADTATDTDGEDAHAEPSQ
jgi:N utilization substance protein A